MCNPKPMRPFIIALLALLFTQGCDNEKAYFSLPYDFPDKQYAGRHAYIRDSFDRARATAYRDAIIQTEAMMERMMVSDPVFNSLPANEQIQRYNRVRTTQWEQIQALRKLMDENR